MASFQHFRKPPSRRDFLFAAGAGALAALLASCAKPETIREEVFRDVEITRVVERKVEVTRITVPETALPEPNEEDGMIFYVDIEHPDALADISRKEGFERVRSQRTQISGLAAGLSSKSILYTELTAEVIREKRVRALVISGNTTDWEFYDFKTFQPLFDIIQSGKIPTIGVCGGHQLIGFLYGADCAAIRKLEPGEPENGDFAPGWFKEVGYLPVQVVKPDPIFAGLSLEPVFFESHYWEMKEVPQGFDLLASTHDVRVQAIRHQQYPIYGTQFHPEVNSAEHRDGFNLLKNFFQSVLAPA